MNPENAQTSTPARRLANLTPLPPRAEFVTQRRPHSPPSPDQTATRSSPDPTAARGVVSPSLHEELAQLRFDHTAADLRARTAEAEARAAEADARAALARKTAQQLDLETRDLASKSSHSQSDSPRSRTRSPHPSSPPTSPRNDLAAILLHLDAQRREDRRRDRQEAEERAAQMEARHQAIQAQMATLVAANHPTGSGGYVVGRALATSIPGFHGDDRDTEDCGLYLLSLERHFKAHGIPASHWANELFLKLGGRAKAWYENAFPDPDTFPPWSLLTSGLLGRFGPRYAAADAWAAWCSALRQEGEGGAAAMQRLDGLQQILTRLGVPAHIGPVEQRCYQLQRLLTPEEKRRWTAEANATDDCSDDAIRAHETAAAAAALTSTGRQSLCAPVPMATRDSWFEPRLASLKRFLLDQLEFKDDKRKPARAAAVAAMPSPAATPEPEDSDDTPPAAGGATALPTKTRPPSNLECRLRLARTDLMHGIDGKDQPNNTPLPPPEYFGANTTHAQENKKEFAKRRNTNACFACLVSKVRYDLHHMDCPQHGLKAPKDKRVDPKLRVKGSALPGQSF